MNNGLTKCEPIREDLSSPILDSRLITATLGKKYNIKLVECGSFTQVYLYKNSKYKKDKNDLELKKVPKNLSIKNCVSENNLSVYCVDDRFANFYSFCRDNIDFEKVFKTIFNNYKKQNKDRKIEMRNIIRSKLTCQRIAKSNLSIWETFITLTFEENINDIKIANKLFKYFIDKIRRVKKDFSYIAIPEFQKRGAIHYHLLTNISIDDKKLMYLQQDNQQYKHIKYWNYGFTSVEQLEGDLKKIIGYISKYMTKDIDNRLFGFRRFFYSQNLITPKSTYIDYDDEKEYNIFQKKIQDKTLIYHNEYISPYDDNSVSFLEYN